MRVISGTAKGRPLKAVPGTGTRPTTDKVKEAVFSMIGPYFDGGQALDLFAGTGGLGIEALSRGMERAVFIDADRKSVEIVQANLQAAGVAQRAEVFRNDAERALKILAKQNRRFDLIFLDPPYKMKHMQDILRFMEEADMVCGGATAVIEHDAAYGYDDVIGGFAQKRRSRYGDTAISMYQFTQGADKI